MRQNFYLKYLISIKFVWSLKNSKIYLIFMNWWFNWAFRL